MSQPEIPKNRIKGFIDVVFLHEGRYYLVDWKSNWLGPDNFYYTQSSLNQAMEQHDYFLQGKIYATALKNYVATVDARPFEECFGGMFYVFLRGINEPRSHGIYYFNPETL